MGGPQVGKAHPRNLLGLLLGYFMQEILFFCKKVYVCGEI